MARILKAVVLFLYGTGMVISGLCVFPWLPFVFMARDADNNRRTVKSPLLYALLTMVFWVLMPVVGIGALFSAIFGHFAWRIQAVLDSTEMGNGSSGEKGVMGQPDVLGWMPDRRDQDQTRI